MVTLKNIEHGMMQHIASGEIFCSEATENFMPTCQQAGKIMSAKGAKVLRWTNRACKYLVDQTKLFAAQMGLNRIRSSQ